MVSFRNNVLQVGFVIDKIKKVDRLNGLKLIDTNIVDLNKIVTNPVILLEIKL